MIRGSLRGNQGRGGFFFLPQNNTMNGEHYINVLEDHMPSTYAIHECDLFIQDSAPCHKTKKVMKWPEDHDIRILKYPGNSQDLNPIAGIL